jgi:predicted TIM-barrel fold metal-dependent hydrolase
MRVRKRLVGWRWKALLGSAVLLIVALVFSFPRPYRPVEPLPPSIIDLHCHAAGIGAGGSGCFISAELRQSWRFGIYLRAFGVTEEDVLESGDSLVIDRISQSLAGSRYVSRAVLLALDGVVDQLGLLDTNRTQIYVPNDFVAEAAARHANLLYGASVNPYRKDAIERLVWAKEHGAVLVKWIPSIMEIDPGDPRLESFYRKLVELKLPLLTHAGKERSFSHAADEFGDPEKLRVPLSLGVKVIAAHLASGGEDQGERSMEQLARLMREYPNLYSDISSLTQLNKLPYMKEALTRPEFSGRLIYGSDFPLINTALVSPWYFSLRLTPKQIFSILKTANPWDADVLLKHDLGMPADVFARSRQLLEQSGISREPR